MILILALILVDAAVIVGLALPIHYLYKKWGDWVNQKSRLLRPFEYELIFGRRSWVARSFDIDSPIEFVRDKINALRKISLESLMFDAEKSKSISPLVTIAGEREYDTGIEISWIDENTAIIKARQYADWPANEEDDVHLPAKQRQRLVERLVIHLKPIGFDKTRVSYEMEIPVWIYVLNIAIVLLVIAAAWAMLQFQMRDAFVKAAGKNHAFIVINTTILWIAIAYISTRITGVFRLQSISLIDNVIATFGRIVSDDDNH